MIAAAVVVVAVDVSEQCDRRRRDQKRGTARVKECGFGRRPRFPN